MGFSTDKKNLNSLLEDIHVGKTQLPEFQRNWVWDTQRVIDLLVSVIRKHPIGSVMLLESGGDFTRFKHRLVEGVKPSSTHPSVLILDGQQRLTSLYGVLKSSQPIKTNERKKHGGYWYYVNLNVLLEFSDEQFNSETNWDDLIVAVPTDRLVRNFRNEVVADFSSLEKEVQAQMLPLQLVFDEVAKVIWQTEYFKHHASDGWIKTLNRLILPIMGYEIPVIQLDKNESKEAVCKVFEKVNTGGVALDVFELLTATFAADDFDLREDWNNRAKVFAKENTLEMLSSTEFLQGVALLVSLEHRQQDVLAGKRPDEIRGVSCKRKNILELTPTQYQQWAGKLEQGFLAASQFLFAQWIFTARDIPYRTQLVPLATLFARLGQDAVAGVQQQLTRWYWCGVFGELYGSATESRFARDVVEVHNWILGGEEPSTIKECNFPSDRLQTLTTRNSAAYKGVHALLLRAGCIDFLEGKRIDAQMYADAKIDIHHVFPKAWCERNGIDASRCDSIINKTPLAARTNRIISDNAPSHYTQKMAQQAKISIADLSGFLDSHLISLEYLGRDDFHAFFEARELALLDRIELVTQRKILR